MSKGTGDTGGKNILTDQAAAIVSPVAEQMGIELVDIVSALENGRRVLRILIDKSEGVTIDDCSSLSQAIDPLLEAAELINGSYDLEVSSPGIERPIVSTRDYERNRGRLVEVVLLQNIDNRSKFEGVLSDFSADTVTVVLDEPFIKGIRPKTNGRVMKFNKTDIKIIRRAIRF